MKSGDLMIPQVGRESPGGRKYGLSTGITGIRSGGPKKYPAKLAQTLIGFPGPDKYLEYFQLMGQQSHLSADILASTRNLDRWYRAEVVEP